MLYLFVACDEKHVIVDIMSFAENLRQISKETEMVKQNVVTRICELDKKAWNEIDGYEKKTDEAKARVDAIVEEQVIIVFYKSVLFVIYYLLEI